MNLDDTQRKRVVAWIAEGLKLSEIQNRIASELGLRLTYMDVRLLVDDLKLTPKDAERPKAVPAIAGAKEEPPADLGSAPRADSAPTEPQAPAGSVSVSVDQLARPGAVVSGKVKFSDGNDAEWFFDQTGRLGLLPRQPGYRPPATDMQQFQRALESELSRMGF